MSGDAGIKSHRPSVTRLTTLYHVLAAMVFLSANLADADAPNFANVAPTTFANPVARNVPRFTPSNLGNPVARDVVPVAPRTLANPVTRNFANLASRNLASPAARNFAHLTTPQIADLAPGNFASPGPRTLPDVPPRLFAPITNHVARATQLYWFNQPTVSPYLNLAISDPVHGLPNYHTFVRPQLQRRQRNMQDRLRVGTRPASSISPSLHRYFPGLRR